MSSDQEDRKEKLARLLAKNKMRLARDKLIKRYREELGYPLTAEQFIDLEVSQRIKQEVYQSIAKLRQQETFDFQGILTALEQLKEQSSQLTVLETAVGIALPDELRHRPTHHHHDQRQRDGAGFYHHTGLRQACGKP